MEKYQQSSNRNTTSDASSSSSSSSGLSDIPSELTHESVDRTVRFADETKPDARFPNDINNNNNSTNQTTKFESVPDKIRQEVINDTKSYFDEITIEDKECIVRSWEYMYKTRTQLIQKFEQSFGDDDALGDFTVKMMNQMTVAIIIEAYNSIVMFLKTDLECRNVAVSRKSTAFNTRENSMIPIDDENLLHRHYLSSDQEKGAAPAATETKDTESNFLKLFKFLEHIGEVHSKHGVNRLELIYARKHFHKVIEKAAGFSWNKKLSHAWFKLTGFVAVGIMSAFKLMEYCDRNIPHFEQFELVEFSWQCIQENLDLSMRTLWEILTHESTDMIDFFPQYTTLKPLMQFGELLQVAHDSELLLATLKNLGKSHGRLGIQRRHFRLMKESWFKMLESVLGVKYNKPTECAWFEVLSFFIAIMQQTVDETWMLSIPPDPEEIKLHIKFNNFGEISTKNTSIAADILVSASNDLPLLIRNLHHGHTRRQMPTFEKINGIGIDSETDQMSHVKSSQSQKKNQKRNSSSSPEWQPRIQNAMTVTDLISEHGKPTLIAGQDGAFVHQQHLVGEFQQQFDMTSYPFDQHLLNFTIRLGCDASVARFDKHEIVTDLHCILDQISSVTPRHSDWHVCSPYFTLVKGHAHRAPHGKLGYDHQCIITVPIQRDWENSITSLFLPLFFIECLGFTAYVGDLSELVFRELIIVLLVATLFIFKTAQQSLFVDLHYNTLLDVHFNFTFLVLFANGIVGCALEQILANFTLLTDGTETVFFAILLSVYTVCKTFLCGQLYTKIRYLRKQREILRKKAEESSNMVAPMTTSEDLESDGESKQLSPLQSEM